MQILIRFYSPELFEKAFTQSLRDFFPIRNKYPDPRAEFYALYQRESQEYDKGALKVCSRKSILNPTILLEFIKKYDDDLNTTLIFVRALNLLHAFITDHLITVWSIFCSRIWVYNRRTNKPAGGLYTNYRYPASSNPPENG